MASGIDHDTHGAIAQLPQELLALIFLRLPISERNNARLVCRQWYHVCNSPFIHKNEKFVFSGVHNIDKIVPILRRSTRQYFNLEFHNIKFNKSKSRFWKKCGRKIFELQFIDCDLSDGMVECVIRYCHKLTHLSWKCENRFAEGTLWSDDVLRTLLEQKLTRENLISLEINLCKRRSLSNHLLSSIFTLFPKIRRFSFFYPLDRGFNSMTIDRDGNRPDVFTFSSIFNKLSASASDIETLKLGSPLCAGFDWRAIALITQLTGLQEIEINDDILRVPEDVLTSFISRQKYLKFMKCTIRYTHARSFIGKLLRCLLTDCVHLQHLHLIYNGMVDVDEHLLMQFAASKLKSFCLRCVDIDTSIPKKLPINCTLRSFTLGSYSVESYRILSLQRGEEIRLALLTIFRNLRYLEMNLVTDAVLRGIWKYQPSLRGLKLSICGNCTKLSFSSGEENQGESVVQSSLNSLSSLQYLELTTQETMRYLTADIIFEGLELFSLKYLRIALPVYQKFHTPLITALEKCSLLEGLSITTEGDGIPYLILAELISVLRRLRFLSILGGTREKRFSVEKYENMFTLCPSLRFMIHRTNTHCEKYYYDFLRERVLKKTSLRRFVIPTENFETFYVNWFAF